MGSIAKSGHAPIVEVIATGARPTKHGMIYAATPANDMICGTSQMASGIGLQVFITGRGTPYNLRAIPVIKVGTRNDLYHQWPDLIDINAGTIASGEEDVAAVGLRLFHRVIDVASGRTQTCADRHQIYNGTYVFNPAPINLKQPIGIFHKFLSLFCSYCFFLLVVLLLANILLLYRGVATIASTT